MSMSMSMLLPVPMAMLLLIPTKHYQFFVCTIFANLVMHDLDRRNLLEILHGMPSLMLGLQFLISWWCGFSEWVNKWISEWMSEQMNERVRDWQRTQRERWTLRTMLFEPVVIIPFLYPIVSCYFKVCQCFYYGLIFADEWVQEWWRYSTASRLLQVIVSGVGYGLVFGAWSFVGWSSNLCFFKSSVILCPLFLSHPLFTN